MILKNLSLIAPSLKGALTSRVSLLPMLLTIIIVSLVGTQAIAYDLTAMHVQETAKRFKAQNKPSHAKEYYDTEIIDYYFNFGAVSQKGYKHGRYYPEMDPDRGGYHSRRVGTFQRKDELGPFPRGEELYVRWKYKKKMYEDHVDLKALLADIDFDDTERLYEAKTGFQIFVKVEGDTLFVYTLERKKEKTILYQSPK